MAPILELKNISKSFPGVRALDDVRFDVVAGEVHALLGENGAGKSTLIKIVSGVYEPDAGTLSVGEREVTFKNPLEAQAAGIATIYQELLLVSGAVRCREHLHGPSAADAVRGDRLDHDAGARPGHSGLARYP